MSNKDETNVERKLNSSNINKTNITSKQEDKINSNQEVKDNEAMEKVE
jgi:hypothetical protein